MSELPRYLKKTACTLALLPLRLLPVKKNRVMLHNDLARNYSANPKYVAEYLFEQYPDQFEIIFSVRDPAKYEALNTKNRKFVKVNSFSYFYYAMTSKVFLSNSGGYSYLPLHKSQYVINTHHGGGAYKTCGLDMFENTKLFRKDLMMSAKKTSVFLSTNKRFTEVVGRAILLPKEKFWEIGMPRNDILFHSDPEKVQAIRDKLHLSEGQHLVLYAPTYRKVDDNYYNDSVAMDYGIDSKRVCAALHERFGGEWIFGLRLHPCVTNTFALDDGNVMDLSGYEEMQELLLAADVMINDFSSSMWDFMLTGKPCFTFATDLQHYVDTTQVYTPVAEWPFPQSTTNEKLVEDILTFNEADYHAACKKHYEDLGGCETGEATKLVCQRICEVCK